MPLVGFNNNVRHRGRVFHIQTEDSGIKYPHVITHLFADGGRILKTLKASYAEHIGTDGLHHAVQSLMKEQHRAMVAALREGELDSLIDQMSTKDPRKASSGSRRRARTSDAPKAATATSTTNLAKPEQRKRTPSATRSSRPKEDSTPSSAAPTVKDTPLEVGQPFTNEAGIHRNSRPSVRYSAARPASIFGASGPSEHSKSVFGQDMLSGKSLDEVILGFLAEEFSSPTSDEDDKE